MIKLIHNYYVSICREILADKKCDPEVIYRFAFSGKECLDAFEAVLCSAKYAYITSAGYFADLGEKAYFHSDKYNIKSIMECIGLNIEHLRISEIPGEHELLIDAVCKAKKLTQISLEDGYFSTDAFHQIIQACSESLKIVFTGMPIDSDVNPLDLNLDSMIVECYANEKQRRNDYLKQNFYRTENLVLRFHSFRDQNASRFFGMKNSISSFVKKLDVGFAGIDTSLNSFNNLLQNIFITYPNLTHLQISFYYVKKVYGLSSLKQMQSFIELWNQQLSTFSNSNNCKIKLFWEMKCVKKIDFKKYFIHRCKELIHGFESTVINENLIEMKSQTLSEEKSFQIEIGNLTVSNGIK
uniref:Uncharacterized protein n=1 Tax=Panagrolaimus sp. PS1159 TaxID=55785 RepID=A0AC35FHU8_9BILA